MLTTITCLHLENSGYGSLELAKYMTKYALRLAVYR